MMSITRIIRPTITTRIWAWLKKCSLAERSFGFFLPIGCYKQQRSAGYVAVAQSPTFHQSPLGSWRTGEDVRRFLVFYSFWVCFFGFFLQFLLLFFQNIFPTCLFLFVSDCPFSFFVLTLPVPFLKDGCLLPFVGSSSCLFLAHPVRLLQMSSWGEVDLHPYVWKETAKQIFFWT